MSGEGREPMDELLFIDEASRRLRRPEATLRWWRHKGIGPQSALLGGRVVYRAGDLDRWIEQEFERQASPAEPAEVAS